MTTAAEIFQEAKQIADERDTPSGWFCIKHDPFYYPCCQSIKVFVHDSSKIIVWPDFDDKNLLLIAEGMKEEGAKHIQILQYETVFGKCISYYKIQHNEESMSGDRI